MTFKATFPYSVLSPHHDSSIFTRHSVLKTALNTQQQATYGPQTLSYSSPGVFTAAEHIGKHTGASTKWLVSLPKVYPLKHVGVNMVLNSSANVFKIVFERQMLGLEKNKNYNFAD